MGKKKKKFFIAHNVRIGAGFSRAYTALLKLEKLSSMNEVKSRSYTLQGENGEWLGQVVLTEDGMFGSVTDYGNLSYSWRSFAPGDLKTIFLFCMTK